MQDTAFTQEKWILCFFSPVSHKILIKGKVGGKNCSSHGRFNIPNLHLLKVLLLMNQAHENLHQIRLEH